MPPSETPFQDESTADLAQAILLMTQELRRRQIPTHKAKAKEPDTFDGSDPRKLNNFILLCNLFFRNNSAYSEDDTKVTFALSYLRGTALEYFEPSILNSDEIPEWMDNWSAFVRTLRKQFGPIDPTAEAEDGIDNLKMQDNQHIVKYNVEFNRLAIRSGWNNNVLRHRYYSGLAERIKDVMGQLGKPPTLSAMKDLAHSIDSRHWERLREKSRSDNSALNSENSDALPSSKPIPTPSDFSGKPRKTLASISDKLGKDGKLTFQERQRRFDNSLCLYCGGTGHMVKECPKSLATVRATKNSDSGNSDSENSDRTYSDSGNSDSESENSCSARSDLEDSDSGDSDPENSENSDPTYSDSGHSDAETEDSNSDSGRSDIVNSEHGNSESESRDSAPENSEPDDSGSDSE